LSETGQVYSWGQSLYGALGLNETGTHDRPRQITVPISTQRVIDIAAGARHSLFLTDQ
jgi:alpha-tubulin suppressor-like RCC1 family protein